MIPLYVSIWLLTRAGVTGPAMSLDAALATVHATYLVGRACFYWIEKPGLYRFALTSDDGSRLDIDNRLVVDNDGIHPIATHFGSVELAGGIHRIRVQYF